MVIALWIAVAVLGIGSLSFASARVTAEEPVAGWLYRMETPRAGGAAVKVDSVQLDAGSPHFAMIAAPWARHVWFVTSDYRRTPAQNLAGWSAPVLRYPSQFEAVNTVALLPLPQLALYTRGGRTMRVVVHDEAGQLVAVDSLRDLNSIPSLLLSEVRAPDPDSVTLTRWRQRFLTIAKDSADSSSIMKFRGWREARWMQAQHPLVPNQKLLVRLITATGDTVARETVTINKAYTDALLSRRS